MVSLTCDKCGYVTTHTAIGAKFALKWIMSNRTELAKCSEYGAKTKCTGILHSGLTKSQIDEVMKKKGYEKYVSYSDDNNI